MTMKDKIKIKLFVDGDEVKNANLSIKETILIFEAEGFSYKSNIKDFNIHTYSKTDLSFIFNGQKIVIKDLNEKTLSNLVKEGIYKKENLVRKSNKPERIFEFYLYNTATKIFDVKPSDNFELSIDLINTDYYFVVETETKLISYIQITENFYCYQDKDQKSFVWSTYDNRFKSFITYSINFNSSLDFLEFVSKFTEAQFKSLKKELTDINLYSNMSTFSEKREIKPPSNILINLTKEEEDSEVEEVIRNFEFANKITKHKNKNLLVDNDRVYVTRGTSLGIFNNDNFISHVENAFQDDPQKLLSMGNAQLVVKEVNNEKVLNLMDLEKGKVVEKWDLERNINDYFHQSQNNLCGVNDYSLFRIDPRTSEKIVQHKDYKTKVGFSVGMSNSNGDIAIASSKGDLRLYDKLNKRAKTLINGYGANAKGIDVSKDGRYILITCDNYILLYDLLITNYKNKVDKEKMFSKRLQLKPQHMHLISNEKSTFTCAKFDESSKFIISSIGAYLIKWRLTDILENNIYAYSIKELADDVVDENFLLKGEDVIVALPDDVRQINKSDLTKKYN
ncbi:VID27 [Hepatospora eriocheir]|uniref:VID27 n=1 Tax=Hepatospora eriocheir TaxID=1081669 RepID=A0A1X0QKJ9_9MICR|nr:VID27 [Hepatospora eriocheir]